MIDITDEKTNGIMYETFDTSASLFFAKTPVNSAEHKGSYRIFADLFFHRCRAVPRKPRKFSTAKISEHTVCCLYSCDCNILPPTRAIYLPLFSHKAQFTERFMLSVCSLKRALLHVHTKA